MIIKNDIINQIRANRKLRIALCDAHDVAETSVMRWLRENHPMLCHKISLQIISAYLKKSEDEIIIMQEYDFKQVI